MTDEQFEYIKGMLEDLRILGIWAAMDAWSEGSWSSDAVERELGIGKYRRER